MAAQLGLANGDDALGEKSQLAYFFSYMCRSTENGRDERPSFYACPNTFTGKKFYLTPRITVPAPQFAVRSQAAQHSPLLHFAVSWGSRVSDQAIAVKNRCLPAVFKQGAGSVKLNP